MSPKKVYHLKSKAEDVPSVKRVPHRDGDKVINKPLIFAMNLSKADIFENMGITNLGPAMVKCALLSLEVLKIGVIRYYAEKEPNLAKELQNKSPRY